MSELRNAAIALTGDAADYNPLLEQMKGSRFVLLGEASHGTQEFYQVRADITMRLVKEHGFNAIAVEADWPDAHRVDCYIRGRGSDKSADDALSSFTRFPIWMWRNTVIREFSGRLRAHNMDVEDPQHKVGFYGIDLYSLHSSADSVLSYLDRVDPDAAGRARQRYSCFEHSRDDPQMYAYNVGFKLQKSCEDAVVQQLIELRQQAFDYANRDGLVAADDFFNAEMNAQVVRNAEQYYRSMFGGRVSTWNMRDSHMADTIDALARHLERTGREPKVIVWAHNSHLGDALATDMGEDGEHNVGQLLRQRHPGQCFLTGFTTYLGSVTAATDWGGPAERKRVRPGLEGSVEKVLHDTGLPGFFLDLRVEPVRAVLSKPLLERAIGVIYRPQTERQSHYFKARVSDQFDAVIHLDETTAVEPLRRTSTWEEGEAPETYPFGV